MKKPNILAIVFFLLIVLTLIVFADNSYVWNRPVCILQNVYTGCNVSYYAFGWENTTTTVSTNLNVNVTVGNVTVAGWFKGNGSLLTDISAVGGGNTTSEIATAIDNGTCVRDYDLAYIGNCSDADCNIGWGNLSGVPSLGGNTTDEIWIVADNETWVRKTGGTMTGTLYGTVINMTENSEINKTLYIVNGRVGIGQSGGFDPRTGLSVTGDFDITHIATEADDHAFELSVDAAGFGDVKGIDVFYDTGTIALGEDEAVILINIDESDATGGDVIGIEILATEGSARIYGLEAGVLVNPVVQLSGTFTDMDSANNSGLDDLTNFTGTNDSSIFVNDNDYITIGDAAKFEEIEFILNTTASNPGIKPTFEYSTGVENWAEFTPTDGTNGMRNTGLIAWFDEDIPTWATGAGTEYLIRINRTQNTLSIIPIEKKVQIASATKYLWDKNGQLKVSVVNASEFYDDGVLLVDTDTTYTNASFDLSQIPNTADINIGDYKFNATNLSAIYYNFANSNSYIVSDSSGNLDIY